MSHPLFLDIKEMGYEELERRHADILKRMQKLRAWGQTSHEMWDQLQLLLDTIDAEKQERLTMQDIQAEPVKHVVVNTDPLPDDEDELAKPKIKNKQYTVL